MNRILATDRDELRALENRNKSMLSATDVAFLADLGDHLKRAKYFDRLGRILDTVAVDGRYRLADLVGEDNIRAKRSFLAKEPDPVLDA